MPNTLDNLLVRLFEQAQLYHAAAAHYYATILNNAGTASLEEATQGFKAAGAAYLAAIQECEQFLLSIKRDEEMERELEHIQTFKHAVMIVLARLP